MFTSETLDEEQTTKTECKNISVKEEKIIEKGDSSMQDSIKSLLLNQGCYDKYFLEMTHTLIYTHVSLI